MAKHEVAYGCYQGDCQMWDTLYVEAPRNASRERIEEMALKDLEGVVDGVAFICLICRDMQE